MYKHKDHIDSVDQPIWFNENFKINNKCFFMNACVKKMFCMYMIFSPNGQIMQYEDFSDKLTY